MIPTTNAGKKFAGVRPTPLLRCYWERLREQLGNMMETHWEQGKKPKKIPQTYANLN
jgi:hypothetical protein